MVQDGTIKISDYPKLYAAKLTYELHNCCPPDLSPPHANEWHWGPTGLGKTFGVLIRYSYQQGELYKKMANKWWDGYKGQKVVLIDEMAPRHEVLAHHLKVWADLGAFPVEIKGATMQIRPEKIIVTSNFSLRAVFADPADYEALERRFTIHRYTRGLKEAHQESH